MNKSDYKARIKKAIEDFSKKPRCQKCQNYKCKCKYKKRGVS